MAATAHTSGPPARGAAPEPAGGAGRPLDEVRREVRSLLRQSPAYQRLGDAEKRDVAQALVKVASFLADPTWIDGRTPVRARALEESDPVQKLKERLAGDAGLVGDDFRAGAVREGTAAFGQLVRTVDFPAFVSGLIQGVFQSIVDASIQQMRAYGELLAATAKTVDQFAKDHFNDAQARDHLLNRYPTALRLDTGGERSRLRASDDPSVDLGREYGIGTVDLDDDEAEQKLVAAAKLEMARSRQQLMATMVLLGINRIVVTNGYINAKVVFDVRASDEARRTAAAEMFDEQKSGSFAAAGFLAPWGGGAAGASKSHVATVKSAVDERSEAFAEAKATLSGDVRVQFKSETFPLERMVDLQGMQMLEQKATPATARA